MKYTIGDNDTLVLVPVLVKKMTEDYLIIKKGDLTTLTTPKAGATVVELLASGHTPLKIKEIISKEFHVDISTVNITPILESLVDNGFISQIGTQVMFREKSRSFVNLKHFLNITLSGNILEFLIKRKRIQLVYPLLKTIFFKKVQIDPALLDRAKDASVKSGFTDKNFTRMYTQIQKQIVFDKTLFFKLDTKALGRWIRNYFVIDNEKYFEEIKDSPIIYCGYHFSNYEMLPIVLGSYGMEVCTPIAFSGGIFEQHLQRTMALKGLVFPAVPQIYSRSEKDGILLFRALKNKKSILLFCDTHILLTDAYFKVHFMGRTIKVNRGAALLHKKTGIPIVPVLAYQKGNRCHIRFLTQLRPDENTSEQEIVQTLFHILEDHIKSYPSQWAKWHDLELMVVP